MAEPGQWEQLLGVGDAAAPRRIADLCVALLDVTGAGMSLVTSTGVRGVICASDDVAQRIEELQLTLGEGPCVDAVTRGGPVLVPDIEDEQDIAVKRWPAFLAAAIEAGVRAVFAFPLRIGVIQLGALDLYRTRPGVLSADQLSEALLAAEAASVAMLELNTSGEAGLAEMAGGAYQAKIHQATGMVMVQAAVPVEQAFLLLRARAFASGRPLSEIADDVVARRLRLERQEP